jgi:hypothetical protein
MAQPKVQPFREVDGTYGFKVRFKVEPVTLNRSEKDAGAAVSSVELRNPGSMARWLVA